AHKEMEKLSYKDPLTGAWNRRYLESEFKNIVSKYKSTSTTLQFALIDLNEFKQLNDTYGHDFGDMALVKVAESFMRGMNDCIVRMGGDEFLVIAGNDDSDDYFDSALKYIDRHAAMLCRGEIVHAYISVGVVSVSADKDPDLESLYKQADIALYKAKEVSRKNNNLSHIVFVEYGNDKSITGVKCMQ
ncbi:MAG: GGDEF domain-containing protein, partial [Gammaproteobacteria bacterium]|nr:GGDEF domain-containing protein [Gammaproteobacteria bacterium]